MSLTALLMASSGPVAPPPNGLTTAWFGDHTATMQPQWDRIIYVGPTRQHKTVAAATVAAYQSPFAKPNIPPGIDPWASGVRIGFARTLIALDAGEYDLAGDIYGIQMGQGIDLIGNTPSRDDVVVKTTSPTRYTVHPWCSFYLANLTIVAEQTTPVADNNYPLHASESGVPGQRDFTAVIDNVRVVDHRASAFGIVGWDMPEGMRAFLYRSRFESTNGHGNVLHGSPDTDVETLFLECEADVPLTVALDGGGSPIGKTWVVDCASLDGTPLPNSAVINMVAAPAPNGIPTTLPASGMSTAELAKFTPSDLGEVKTYAPDYPSTTNLSGFSPGRTYYIPMTIPAAAKIAGAKMNVVSPVGTVSAGMRMGKRPGVWEWTYGIYSYDAATATSGDNVTLVQAGDSEFYLPAKTKVYLAVRVNSASCVVRASADMSASVACYFTDDADAPSAGGVLPYPSTAQPVTPGDPVPWVALITAA